MSRVLHPGMWMIQGLKKVRCMNWRGLYRTFDGGDDVGTSLIDGCDEEDWRLTVGAQLVVGLGYARDGKSRHMYCTYYQ